MCRYLLYKCVLTLACTQVYSERSSLKLKIFKTRLITHSEELLKTLMLISTRHASFLILIKYIIKKISEAQTCLVEYYKFGRYLCFKF